MDIVFILLLTLINAAFAMSEMALSASRKARLVAMQEAGDKGAQAALVLMQHPTEFLSTVQIGITSIGILNGIVGEAAFSHGVAVWLQAQGLSDRSSEIAATAFVVSIITFFTIVFGELVPKRIGQMYPETVARWVSPTMRTLAMLARPFVRLLSASTAVVLKLLRIDTSRVRTVTEEEITASLEEGVDAGLIESHEHEMVKNVFHLDDRSLTSIMVPRSDIVWLEESSTVDEALAHLKNLDAHSWYPVCRQNLDDVIGLVSMSKLLHHAVPTDLIKSLIEPATFLPETLTGLDLLEQFRRPPKLDSTHLAYPGRLVLIVDEYGVVQGMMTPLDLLEAITGELLQATTQADAWAIKQEDGAWLLDGLMPVQELKSRLQIEELPFEDKGRYNTLAGLVMALLGRVSQTQEFVDCAGWRFRVIAMDGKRIDKIIAQVYVPDV